MTSAERKTSPTIAVVQAWSLIYRADPGSNDAAARVYHCVAAARAAGARWDWDAAEENLDAAYAAVGQQNPGTGFDWHRGWHPLQPALRDEIAHLMDEAERLEQ